MDGFQFDALTQRLTSIRLTRSSALRGMVAGALTLAGTARVAEEASAGKKKKVCHCLETAGGACNTMKVKKKQAKTHLRDHQCDYQGACRNNITACAAAPIFVNAGRLGTACSSTNPCGANSGLECVGGFCMPLDLNTTCSNNGECSAGRCTDGVCVDCPILSICGSGSDAQCCAVDVECNEGTGVCGG